MKVAIYVRVSTKEQTTENQLEPLKEYCLRNKFEIFKIYNDIGESGSKESRPQFNEMIADLRKGKFKAIAVWKLDRIGRSLQHLLSLFTEFNKRGIEFISLTQNIDTTTPEGRMFLRMLMIMSEYERELIINRVNAGLDRAKRQGKNLGRPKNKINKFAIIKLRKEGKSLRKIASELDLSLAAVQRCIKSEGQHFN